MADKAKRVSDKELDAVEQQAALAEERRYTDHLQKPDCHKTGIRVKEQARGNKH